MLLGMSALCSFPCQVLSTSGWAHHGLLPGLPSMGGHPGCFQFKAVLNKAAVNLLVDVCLQFS